MNVLITGRSGSAGSYLAEWLAEHQPDVVVAGTTRGDLDSVAAARALLDRVGPDVVVHLASDPDVKRSFDRPVEVFQNNVPITLHLFEAVRLSGTSTKVVLGGTPEVYGRTTDEKGPIREDQPIRPANPYAASKAAQEAIAQAYASSYGIPVITTRAFSYVNPRRDNLFSSAFARQIALAEKAGGGVIRHGYLGSVRSMTDVRDIARAYWLATTRCRPGVYNVGDTHPITVRAVLERMVKLARVPIDLVEDPALHRPVDVPYAVPDTSAFVAETQWRPEISLDASLSWLLDEWRRRT